MPFPGIEPGSELEQKIDRCLATVQQKNPKFSKSQAIAICRASVAGTTTKRSRGPAETRAIFAKMGAAGKLRKRGAGGKRTGEELPPTDGKPQPKKADTRTQKQIDDEIKAMLNGMDTGGNPEDDILLPGRAPRGQGKEYQARQWVYDRVTNMDNRATRLTADIRADRGTSRSSREIVRKKMALQSIDDTLQVVRHVINNLKETGSDFADAKGLFQELLSIPTAMTSGIKEAKPLTQLRKQVKKFVALRNKRIKLSLRTTEKAKIDAVAFAKYRPAGPASTQVCQTCKFKANERLCTLYDFGFDDNYVCNSWLPNIKALRERSAEMRNTATGKTYNPVILQMIATKRANYSARAGQPITQNLRRGNDGEFESTGQSDTAQSGLSDTQMEALKLLAEGKNIQGGILAGLAKLGLVDKSGNLTANGKTAVSHIESGDIDKIKSLLSSTGDGKPGKVKKPKGKKGGGGKGGKPTKEQIRAENLTKLTPQLLKAGISQAELNGIISFSDGGELTPAVAKSLVSKGLLSIADGKPTTNAFTRSFLSGIDKGNARVAIDAIRQAKEAMIRAIAREEAKKKGGGKKSKNLTPPTFTVFKDTNGRPRWLSVSSSSYRDKDGEIVSLKAIKTAVNRNDTAANHGPLRWWHLKGAELGTTDLSIVLGKMLVESGTFKNSQIAQRVQQNVDNLGMSIGFKHPITEPDQNGVFHNINIFERSLLPRKRASNHFTKLTVKGDVNNMANTQDKLAQLAQLLGDGEVLQGFLSQVQQTDKEAEAAGVAHKETTENPTIDELMEVWTAYKEAEAEVLEESFLDDSDLWQEEEVKAMDEKKAEGTPAPQANRPVTRDEFNAGINRLAALISGKGQSTEKDTAEIEQINARLLELEATKEVLQTQLDELNGAQPRAMSGYRASQQGEITDTPHGTDEATKEIQEMAKGVHAGAAQMLPTAAAFADLFSNTNGGII